MSHKPCRTTTGGISGKHVIRQWWWCRWWLHPWILAHFHIHLLILDLSRSLDRDEPGQAGIVPLSQVWIIQEVKKAFIAVKRSINQHHEKKSKIITSFADDNKTMKIMMKIESKVSFFQTSLHLNELSPDSRYELTVNLANRKVFWCFNHNMIIMIW